MSDLLDVQVRCYPEILRRLAAGEKIASSSSEAEKLAATMLVVEALENEKRAQPAPVAEKKAVDVSLLTLGLGALALPQMKAIVQKLRGEPAVPEAAEQLLKSFRTIIDERAKAEVAKRTAVLAGLGGAAAGAAAVKLLDKSKDEKSSSDKNGPVVEKKAEGETPADVSVPAASQETQASASGSPGSRALLDKVLKNLQ